MKKYQSPKAEISLIFSAKDIINASDSITYRAYELDDEGGVGDIREYIG